MYCGNCGKEIDNDSRFCGYCGAPVNAEANLKGESTSGSKKLHGTTDPLVVPEEEKNAYEADLHKQKHPCHGIPFSAPNIKKGNTRIGSIVESVRPKKHSVWSILSIVSLVCSFITFSLGIDKMVHYNNSDYSPVNAYVGGDAYNFIINGTYTTAFFVLTMMFVLASIGLMILHYVARKGIASVPKTDQKADSVLEDIESHLPEL